MACALDNYPTINVTEEKCTRSARSHERCPQIQSLFSGLNGGSISGANQSIITECPIRKVVNSATHSRIICSSIMQTGTGRMQHIYSKFWTENVSVDSVFTPELVSLKSIWKRSQDLKDEEIFYASITLIKCHSANHCFVSATIMGVSYAAKLNELACLSDGRSPVTLSTYEVSDDLVSANVQTAGTYTNHSVRTETYRAVLSPAHNIIVAQKGNCRSPGLDFSKMARREEHENIYNCVKPGGKPRESRLREETYTNLSKFAHPECLVDVNFEISKDEETENTSEMQKRKNVSLVQYVKSKAEKLESERFGEIKSLACDRNISKLEKNVPSMNSVVPTYLKQNEQINEDTGRLSGNMTEICPLVGNDRITREELVEDAALHTEERTNKSPVTQSVPAPTDGSRPLTLDAENVSSSGDCSSSASICSPLTHSPHEDQRVSCETVPSVEQTTSTFPETSRNSSYDTKLDDEDDDSTYKRMTVRALLKKYERLTDELKRTNRTIDMFLGRRARKLSKPETTAKKHTRNRNSKGCESSESKSTESITTTSQVFEDHNDQDHCMRTRHGPSHMPSEHNRWHFSPCESKSQNSMVRNPEALQSSTDRLPERNSAPEGDSIICRHNSASTFIEGSTLPSNYPQPFPRENMKQIHDVNSSDYQNAFPMASASVPPITPKTHEENQYSRGVKRMSNQSTEHSVKESSSSSRSRSTHHSGHRSRHRTASRRKSCTYGHRHPSRSRKRSHSGHHPSHHHRAKSHCANQLSVKCFPHCTSDPFISDVNQYYTQPECPNHFGFHSIPYTNLVPQFGSMAPVGVCTQPVPLNSPFGPTVPPNTVGWSYAPWSFAHVPLRGDQTHYHWVHTHPPLPFTANPYEPATNELFTNIPQYSQVKQTCDISTPSQPEYPLQLGAHSKSPPCTDKSALAEAKHPGPCSSLDCRPIYRAPPGKPQVVSSSTSEQMSYSGMMTESVVSDRVHAPVGFTGRTIPRSPLQRLQEKQLPRDALTVKQAPDSVWEHTNEHQLTEDQASSALEIRGHLGDLPKAQSSFCGDQLAARERKSACDCDDRGRMNLAEIPTKLASEVRNPKEIINVPQNSKTNSGVRTNEGERLTSAVRAPSGMQSIVSSNNQVQETVSQKHPTTARSAIISRANLPAEPVTPEQWKNVELRYDYLQKQKMLLEGKISSLPQRCSMNKVTIQKEEAVLLSYLTPIDRELSALRLLMRKRCSQTRTMIKMK